MKKKKRKKVKKTLQPKGPLSVKEAEQKIKSIRAKLQDLKEYKVILAEDGLKPDEEDKRRESELIVRLLRLEKQAGVTKEKDVPWRGKSGDKPGPNKSSPGKSGPSRPGTSRPGGSKDSQSKDRDRRPSKDGPARSEKKFRDDKPPVREPREGRQPRETRQESDRPDRSNKKTINRGSKPSGAKKTNAKKGPKKPGGKPPRRPFAKKTKAD